MISIHALLAESDVNTADQEARKRLISIHALLAESDPRGDSCYLDNLISIHALLAESDICVCWTARSHLLFLSTLSLRRATLFFIGLHLFNSNFYPRSPCGERRILPHHARKIVKFLSTLSLRRATSIAGRITSNGTFLSTLSLRRATRPGSIPGLVLRGISIHALLAESDADTLTDDVLTGGFLSTLSLRRATRNGFAMRWNTCISIHALLAESDCPLLFSCWLLAYFYPRSPCGERPWRMYPVILGRVISIHALLAESDSQCR